MQFLSTLPARGATNQTDSFSACPMDFYPRSPRGERRAHDVPAAVVFAISIHAPREGSDVLLLMVCNGRFQISIHAPREGSDLERLKVERKA